MKSSVSSHLTDAELAELNELLTPAYRRWLSKLELRRRPTLFIVGAPRSGTTLLTQILASGTDIGFVNNLTARLWRVPALAMAMQQHAGGPSRPGSFDSELGATFTMEEPGEFGFFWRRWFAYGESHAVAPSQLAGIDGEALCREIMAMGEVAGAPMMFKNLAACGMNAGFLSRLLPQSLFLFVDRCRVGTARSILKARLRSSGRLDPWFSVRPPGTSARENTDPIGEVLWQIEAIGDHLCAELAEVEPLRLRRIHFDDLTRHPGEVTAAVRAWMSEQGAALNTFEIALPQSFRSESVGLPEDIEGRLRAAAEGSARADRLAARFPPLLTPVRGVE